MEPGDPVFLWTTGTHPIYKRGILGFGYVTDYAQSSFPDNEGDDYWFEAADRDSVIYRVPVDIPLRLSNPLTNEELHAVGIRDLEVQRQMQGANPSWVSKKQLAKIEQLYGPFPPFTESRQPVHVSMHGAGFGPPMQNKLVETAAMEEVKHIWGAQGWDHQDVSGDKMGWDITFTRGDETARVEVKGSGSDHPIVLLTTNEVRAAESIPDWLLVVVTDPRSRQAEASAVQSCRRPRCGSAIRFQGRPQE